MSLFAVPGLCQGRPPTICLSSPAIELQAGVSLVEALLVQSPFSDGPGWADIFYRIDDPLARRCTASVIFDDPDFLPVTYTFEAARCAGPELASFAVPLGAPSGGAYVKW